MHLPSSDAALRIKLFLFVNSPHLQLVQNKIHILACNIIYKPTFTLSITSFLDFVHHLFWGAASCLIFRWGVPIQFSPLEGANSDRWTFDRFTPKTVYYILQCQITYKVQKVCNTKSRNFFTNYLARCMSQYRDMSQWHSAGSLHHILVCFSLKGHPQVVESQGLAGGLSRLVLIMGQISHLWMWCAMWEELFRITIQWISTMSLWIWLIFLWGLNKANRKTDTTTQCHSILWDSGFNLSNLKPMSFNSSCIVVILKLGSWNIIHSIQNFVNCMYFTA